MLPLLALLSVCMPSPTGGQSAAPLPSGVRAVWDVSAAFREVTPTRERVCLNGLWRWQPAHAGDALPDSGWGWFKVPGCWPGITDYLQKDCQTVIPHPSWSTAKLESLTSAWYQREIRVPANWGGRRIAVSAEYVDSLASVYVDGKRAGEIRFPAGETDVTSLCQPGSHHLLSLQVTALPLKDVMTSYTDTNAAREVAGRVARRGLCGDVYLVSAPRGPHVRDVRIDTSFRHGQIAVNATLEGLSGNRSYSLRADIRDNGQLIHTLISPRFNESGLREGRIEFSDKWMPRRLWDINTPKNQLTAQVSLADESGKTLDSAIRIRFGFREFWITGRDFYLNGSRIFLSVVPLDNAQVGAAWSTYDGARESLERLKSFGINFVYTHNYDCEPGSHLSFSEILRAADDVGMLVALSQPHFSSYDWQAADADQTNGYARHAAFYTHVAGSHPSVVAYAMSHNATSYDEAKNPDMIDGLQSDRDNWASNNVRKALRAEAIVERLDSSRIVYHHSSGNLGSMYTENFYVNFAPIQELDDWFGHWATKGVKPLFLCEYGVPFSWDWTMYRGWYKGKREWGSAEVPWEFCMAEWSAQFLGDRAYKISEMEKTDLRWEAAQFRTRDGWHRWDYPYPVGSSVFDEPEEIFAAYITDNWRAYRTWGVSAFSPWEYEVYWRLRPGIDRKRKELPVDWEHLQRPGFSPDYIDSQYETMDLSYSRSDWVPTEAAQALLRNNRPLLAYIGDKASSFTSKDHHFAPGQTVEKQLIVINNSRESVTCDCRWSLNLPQPATGAKQIRIATGDQARIPIRISLPATLAPGRYILSATFTVSSGEVQRDSFAIDVVRTPSRSPIVGRIALFDPMGETAKLLDGLGIHCQPITATTDLAGFDVLIVGKKAINLNGAIPDVKRVRTGLKVIVFEQSADVLERRLGFRIAEYGMRNVFRRVQNHPILAGLTDENLHDWNGEATLSTPRLQYTLKPMYGPIVKWCGIEVPRVWRCGCQGNVASVLIEKPARGDFLPIIDGGYSLQYSPLMEYREGSGMALFCQLDVTGRTETDPAAARLARNLLQYACNWKPAERRNLVYAGDEVGLAHLRSAGFAPESHLDASPANAILVAGPGSERDVSRQILVDWISRGGKVLAVGANDLLAIKLPGGIQIKTAEHIASFFEANDPWLAGIGPADVHDRDCRAIPLVTGGTQIVGDGVLARSADGAIELCQLVPWQFDVRGRLNVKRTFRRSSFLLTRLLGNLGVASATPMLEDMSRPIAGSAEHRWLDGLYLDIPEEWDDPYRFFGW